MASDTPSEKVNSPASVEGMLPPHIELASRKRKQSGASAPSAGPGNGTRARRRDRYEQTGRRTMPSTVTSLNAMGNGIACETSAQMMKGSGKYSWKSG